MAAMGRLVAGRYRIVRPLGAGGLGRVWLATDEVRGRPVALKEYLPPGGLVGAEQELVAGWMIREARAFAQIRHPHVVRVLDVLPGARILIDDGLVELRATRIADGAVECTVVTSGRIGSH